MATALQPLQADQLPAETYGRALYCLFYFDLLKGKPTIKSPLCWSDLGVNLHRHDEVSLLPPASPHHKNPFIPAAADPRVLENSTIGLILGRVANNPLSAYGAMRRQFCSRGNAVVRTLSDQIINIELRDAQRVSGFKLAFEAKQDTHHFLFEGTVAAGAVTVES